MSEISKAEIEEIVRATVNETLFGLGLKADEKDDIEEVRRDMAHLRKWRKSVEKMENVGVFTAWAMIVTALLTLLWTGFLTLVK